MKNYKFLLFFFILIFTTDIFAQKNTQRSSADIYRAGKVRFIPEIVLDDNSMPEDIFFQSPLEIICDNKGNIYISDYKANNIKKFDSSGKFIKIIGRQGQGPGDFSMPSLMTLAKDCLVVWDQGNRRLCTLTLNGEFIKAVEISTMEGWPRKLRSLPNGDIIIEREKIYFGEANKPQDCTIEIYSSELKHKKTIYSQKVWRRKHIIKAGRMIPVPFPQLMYWDVSPDGKIVIGYSEKYEITIYDPARGKISSFTYSHKPVKLTEKDKKDFFNSMRSRSAREQIVKRSVSDFIVENTVFPKYKPAFFNIIVDSEGNILVSTFRKKEYQESRFFDAFDSEGNFIRNVQVVGDIPFPGIQFVRIVKNSFWLRKEDEDSLVKVIKYRISD